MKNNEVKFFDSYIKATHYALYLDFKYRTKHLNFLVCKTEHDTFMVCQEHVADHLGSEIIYIPKNLLEDISYEDISDIAKDTDPLLFWEDIQGMFSTVDNQILMFILKKKIPLEMFIHYELSCRGFDKNNRWIGFNASEKIWLESD